MTLPELLSPAGGMDQLKAAVENGADAVYMGGKAFNARQNADNFGEEELRRAIEYAHIRGVNIYVTMNTLVADAEMQEAVDAAGAAYMAGADALIVQDLGFASLVRRHIPDLPLHISTQGTIYSPEGIRALAPLGFARAILARELSLHEIARTARESPVPVEVFAHGALCVCYSGQCLMSSMIGSRSGNRGRCAQPCRLPYALGGEKGYLLSPKDLCTVELLPRLVETGVAALKIEGRMKSPEYVAVVTSVYRKYLDRIAEGGPYAVDEADMRDLLQVFNRGGFTTGYLEGRRGRELICRERPRHPGVPVGHAALRDRARASFAGRPRRKVTVSGEFCARAGERMRFAVWDEHGNRAESESERPAEKAVTKPLTAQAALVQLTKTGGSPFELAGCQVDLDGLAAAKLSELNALRREALAGLGEARANRHAGRTLPQAAVSPPCGAQAPAAPRLSVFLHRWRADLKDLLHLADRVYAPFAAFARGQVKPEKRPQELMAWLPGVTNGRLGALLREHAGNMATWGLDGVLVGNAEHMELLKSCGLPLYGDATLNAFNAFAVAQYAAFGIKGVTLSTELTLAQVAAMPFCGVETEAAVYGRLPLMTSAHCPVGAELGGRASGRPCGLCRGNAAYALRDRTGAVFPVLCDATDCRSTVLNCDALAVPDLVLKLMRAGVSTLRLYLYDETPAEAERLLMIFRSAAQGEVTEPLRGRGYTKGHYFREV
jgi:putative protease